MSEETRINGTQISIYRRPVFWVAVAAVALALVAGPVLYKYYAIRETTDDAQIDGHINQLSARVGGTVVEVCVDDNQYVTQGTLLVRLDTRDYDVALQRAQADLAEAEGQAGAAKIQVPITSTTTSNQEHSAQAALSQAESAAAVAAHDVGTANARLALARARAEEARVNYTKATQDLGRLKQLIVKDEVSKQDYDNAVAAEDATRAAQASAEAAVAEAEKSIEAAEARLAQARQTIPQAQAGLNTARTAPEQTAIMRDRAASAEAKVQVARANVEQAKLNLQYTAVRAPVDGVISMKTVEVGQIVQPGQPLLAVVPLENVWVTANFKESQLKNMRPGQPAKISVDAYGGRTYRGRVESIAAATGARFSLLPPENATGNYVKVVQRIPVKIVFEQGQDPQHLLRPGMSVEPTVFTGR